MILLNLGLPRNPKIMELSEGQVVNGDSIRLIPLTNGGVTIVDADIYDQAMAAAAYNRVKREVLGDNPTHYNEVPDIPDSHIKSVRKDNSTKVRGVRYMSGPGRQKRWNAQITVNKRTICIGYFATREEAAEAYNKRAIELLGPKAKLNTFPLPPVDEN